MNLKTFAAAGCAVTALFGGAAAFAQQPAAPAAPRPVAAAPATPAAGAQITHGPAIPGVCVVSVDAAIFNSTVGKNANTRLQQIAQQAQAEITQEQTAIQNDGKALEGQRATLSPDVYEQRLAALQVRANALQRKADLRSRELDATQQKVRARLGQEVEPLLVQVYQQKQCSVLMDGNVLFANPAMNLTPQLVTALNGKIQTFQIDRERLDVASPAAPAAPATPRK
jgi:outer membrane protein